MCDQEYISEKSEKACPRCNKSLPLFAKDGKHNFCPTITSDEKIIHICIKCKLEETAKK